MQIPTTIYSSGHKRERLQSKMRELFSDEMKRLEEDMQDILIDDIVTAFLNRISLFIKIDAEKEMYTRTKRSLNP